jgi:hypothetical protein
VKLSTGAIVRGVIQVQNRISDEAPATFAAFAPVTAYL